MVDGSSLFTSSLFRLMVLQSAFPNVTTIVVEEPILKTQCLLGEGPIWEPSIQTLHFVDISKSKLYHYHPETKKLEVEVVSDNIGCLALREKGGLACAAEHGFATLSTDSWGPSKLEYLCKPMSPLYEQYTRYNDGACDLRGIFWAGILQFKTPEGKRYPGQLWRFDPETNKATMEDDDNITDSNAIGWSADNKTMYFVNSDLNVIYAYDYDPETSQASNRRIFVDGHSIGLRKDLYGNPDGFCIDREGSIWCARWRGSRIVRFTPDGKGVDLEIHIPKAYNITACCFGGPNMDKLFITTASPHACEDSPDDENEAYLKEFPMSGDTFMVDFAALPESVVDNHKGLPLGPNIGDREWRFFYKH